jgi:hypothetical protein
MSTGLAARMPASNNTCVRCSTKKCAGPEAPSQSTSFPNIENSKASKAPMPAVNSVIHRRYGRRPSEHFHMKAKKVRGRSAGIVSGYGFTRFSNQSSIRVLERGLSGCDAAMNNRAI